MRNHGLETPYNPMQVATWIILPSLFLHYGLFLTPVFPRAASIPLTIAYYLLGLGSAYFAFVTSVTDPIDDLLYSQLHDGHSRPKKSKKKKKRQQQTVSSLNDKEDGDVEMTTPSTTMVQTSSSGLSPNKKDDAPPSDLLSPSRKRGGGSPSSSEEDLEDVDIEGQPQQQPQQTTAQEEDDPTKFCWVCQTQVKHHSMHCKFCNKCVSHFDHHCMWLNTCIGEANYNYFYRTVVVTFAFVLLHLASIVGFIIAYFAIDDVKARCEQWMRGGKPGLVLGFNIVFGVLTFGALSLIGQLLIFHLGLRKQGISTYEYIVKDNQAKREKSKFEMEVRSKRIVAIRRAKSEGERMEVISLVVGGCAGCESCDPIRRGLKTQGETASKTSAHRDFSQLHDDHEEEEDDGNEYKKDDDHDEESEFENESCGTNGNTLGFEPLERQYQLQLDNDQSVSEQERTGTTSESSSFRNNDAAADSVPDASTDATMGSNQTSRDLGNTTRSSGSEVAAASDRGEGSPQTTFRNKRKDAEGNGNTGATTSNEGKTSKVLSSNQEEPTPDKVAAVESRDFSEIFNSSLSIESDLPLPPSMSSNVGAEDSHIVVAATNSVETTNSPPSKQHALEKNDDTSSGVVVGSIQSPSPMPNAAGLSSPPAATVPATTPRPFLSSPEEETTPARDLLDRLA